MRKKGIALFKYNDRIGGADVIFGEGGDHVLLGAFTLLGVVVITGVWQRQYGINKEKIKKKQ